MSLYDLFIYFLCAILGLLLLELRTEIQETQEWTILALLPVCLVLAGDDDNDNVDGGEDNNHLWNAFQKRS